MQIDNWNVAENNVWYVRLADSGAGISVELYLTEAEAEAQANLQASGESSGYGSTPVSLFIEEYSWHLLVSGTAEDETKIFKLREFIEMDEISHSIYRNSTLITARATAEIEAHTHSAIIRDVVLGIHLPEIEVGQIVRLDSDRRGVDDLSQVYEQRIIGSPNSLVSELETRKYLELKR
jgi:hypothetical protein